MQEEPTRSGVAHAAIACGGLLLCLLVVPSAAVAAGSGSPVPASPAAVHAVRWGFLIGIAGEAVILGALALTGGFVQSLVIGRDNRWSTSKTSAAVWTLTVAAALVAVVYASLLNHPQALNATNSAGVVGQYALLFGGPLGAAILAKGIVTKQVNDNPSVKQPAQSTTPIDLVANDAGEIDLGDFQYVLFSLVALIYVVGTLLHDPTNGLPHIPDVLLGLTSVSAVGYVGKKALTPTGLLTGVAQPSTGSAGTQVTISISGLTPLTQPQTPLWVRFHDDPGEVVRVPVTDGTAQVQIHAPPLPEAAARTVAIGVITANGVVIGAGSFRYT